MVESMLHISKIIIKNDPNGKTLIIVPSELFTKNLIRYLVFGYKTAL